MCVCVRVCVCVCVCVCVIKCVQLNLNNASQGNSTEYVADEGSTFKLRQEHALRIVSRHDLGLYKYYYCC